MEKRKNKRIPFQAKVKIGYFLEDIELCPEIDCQDGMALVKTGESAVEKCSTCQGRGFKPKNG